MILTQLYEYDQYSRSQQSAEDNIPSMYGKVKIRWLIPIDADGNLQGQLKDLKGATKAEQRGAEYIMPNLVRASGIKPKLLADNGEYVLGLLKDKADPQKVQERHRQFKELVKECWQQTQHPALAAICQFYARWDPATFTQTGVDPVDNFTFAVHGLGSHLIIPASAQEKHQNIQDFWAAYTADPTAPRMDCLVTGKQNVPVEARLPGKLKGIPNGQTAGTSLVSANAAPFSSYGLENSLTSPISREAAEGFTNAINGLIGDERSRIYLGPVVYMFWTQQQQPIDDFMNCFAIDQPQEARDLFRSPSTGQQRHGIQSDRFYGLGLSASGGRAVVRSWIDIAVADAKDNIDQWFAAREIVDRYGQKAERPYFSVKTLAKAMYRDGEEFKTQCAKLIDVALQGGKLPWDMLARTVRRIAIEHDVSHPRAALIKLILTYNLTDGDYRPMAAMNQLNLDPDFADTSDVMAYHCGRLLAQLENIQKAAQGDINTTLIDRYYGAAASNPGKVFGELVKDAQAHLRKLRVNKPGTCEALQQQMESIIVKFSPASTFPNTLTMQQQSIFALGYYHQRAANRKEAIDRKAANEAKKAAEAAKA